MIPLVWSRDEEHSYETFRDCFFEWVERAKSTVDIKEEFYMDEMMQGTPEENYEFLRMIDYNYMAFYAEIEERF